QSARTRQRKPGCALSLRSRASVSPDLRSSRATSRRLSPSSSVMHRVASLLPDSLVDFRCLALTGRPVITNLAARMHIHDDIALLAFRDSKPGTVPGRTTVRRFGHFLQDRVLDGKSLLLDVLFCNVEAIGGKGGGTEAEQRAQPQDCELHGASPFESGGFPPNGWLHRRNLGPPPAGLLLDQGPTHQPSRGSASVVVAPVDADLARGIAHAAVAGDVVGDLDLDLR